MASNNATLMIKAGTENEVLAKIEMISDTVTRNAVLSLFFWRLATQTVVSKPSTERST